MQNGRTAPSSAPIANLSVNTLAGRKLMDNQYYNFLAIAATTKLWIEPVIPLALKPEKIKPPTVRLLRLKQYQRTTLTLRLRSCLLQTQWSGPS